MPITTTEIEWRLSGGAANANANASLGGVMSSVAVPASIFDDVSGAESAAGDTEYRCFFLLNSHGSLTWQSVIIWLDAVTAQTDLAEAIGLDGAAIGTSTSASTSADENTAPSPAVTFSSPTTKGTGLSIGNLGPGQMKAVWIRRTVTAGAAAANATFSVRAEGDTNA
jgi:hypothetical protein